MGEGEGVSDMEQSEAKANIYNKIIEWMVLVLSAYLIILGSLIIYNYEAISYGLIGLILFIAGLTLHDRFFELKKKKKEVRIIKFKGLGKRRRQFWLKLLGFKIEQLKCQNCNKIITYKDSRVFPAIDTKHKVTILCNSPQCISWYLSALEIEEPKRLVDGEILICPICNNAFFRGTKKKNICGQCICNQEREKYQRELKQIENC